ncbi:MAG TPA: GyrI-like domain-containing protein, partial [Acidimicrobiales bacterium]
TLPQPEIVEVVPVTTAVVRAEVAMAEMQAFFDRTFTTLGEVLATDDAGPTGAAFALYHRPLTDSAQLEVGFPTDRPVQPRDGVEVGALPGGRVARLVHEGGFDGLGASWERLVGWAEEQGLTLGPDFWEVYVTEPSPDMDPADLRTELNWTITG